MSKASPAENPSDTPRKHFGATLPDLKAEQAKKLPTGSAKLIAIDAAKEIGLLTYDLVKSGGLLTPVKLLSLGWKAISIYRNAKAEALRRLNETYLTGRDVWAQHIMGDVEDGKFDVSGNEPVKQDIRDFLHGTPPAPTSPLREKVRTQYRKQKEYEAVIASLEEMEKNAEGVVAALEANPPEQADVAARADELRAVLQQGEQALQQAADAAGNDGGAPAATDRQAENRDYFLRRSADPDRKAQDKVNELVSWVGNVFEYGVRLPGITRTPNVPPTLRGEVTTKSPQKFSRLDGTFERDGVRIVFDGVIVDEHGSWHQSDSVPSRITMTTPDGEVVAQHQFAPLGVTRPGGRTVRMDDPALNRDLLHVAQVVANAGAAGGETATDRRYKALLERGRSFIDNPLTLVTFLTDYAANESNAVAGLSITPAQRPTSISAEYADKQGYRRVDGTVRGGNGTTVGFDGIIVDHAHSWLGNATTPSTIRITAPEGKLEIKRQHSHIYFVANGRNYDYHSGTADADYSGRMLYAGLEAMRSAA